MLERLDGDDVGLYSDGESDCEAEGIAGYMSEADDDLMADISRGEALDDEEEGTMDTFSALTASLVASQYF